MISLHLIPMDKEGNLLPSEKWSSIHEWRGHDGRGFYSVNMAIQSYPAGHFGAFLLLKDQIAKVPAGNTLAGVWYDGNSLYAALVGHFDDPADATDYFEDAPIVAQDTPEGEEGN